MALRKPFLATLALAAALTAGCEASDDSGTSVRRDRDRDGITDRYDRSPSSDDRRDSDDRVILGRDRDRDRLSDRDLDRDTYRDRDAGTRLDRRAGLTEIPRGAVQVKEGEGRTIRYTPTRDGRVYVYDEDDDRVVYSGTLERGETFVADPDRDTLTVNGRRLGDINLRAKHRYQIYFDRQ